MQTKIEFEQNFYKICIAYGADPAMKHNQCLEYYKSNLKKLSSSRFNQLIEKAKTEIITKTGYIPQISQLTKLLFALNKEKKIDYLQEPRCNKCDDLGYITLIAPDDYEYCFVCTCATGQEKKIDTTIGRQCSYYTAGIDAGYELRNKTRENVPF